MNFLLNRMHILIHGKAADGVSAARADKWFKISQPMIHYVISRGDLDQEDINDNIAHAKTELADRSPPRPNIRRADALKTLSQYYIANKDNLPRDLDREAIVQDILNGLTAEEAFGRRTR